MKETKIKYTIKNIKDCICVDGKYPQLSFIESDCVGVMKELGGFDRFATIICYEGTQEEKEIMLRKAIESIEEIGEMPIVTDSYISTNEFPNNEWRHPHIDCWNSEQLKLPVIPVDEIMLRECNLLTNLGFININQFINYEFKEAFIYGNNAGKRIKEYFENMNDNN